MVEEKNLVLFEKHHIFTRAEAEARAEILLEKYAKTINIEGLTLAEMIVKDVLPGANSYVSTLAKTIAAKKASGISAEGSFERQMLGLISDKSSELYLKTNQLKALLEEAINVEGVLEQAKFYSENICGKMLEVRAVADELEKNISDEYLPYPTYGQLLFSVN